MYLSWNEKTITDFSQSNIESWYDQGYVLTRVGKGVMRQTRSVRINLAKFVLSSENRRVLKKVKDIELSAYPLPDTDYDWTIGKMAKDFYNTKFGDNTFSANKIKEIMTEDRKSNFNCLLKYSSLGYCIAYASKNILHYSYPFYNILTTPKDMGLGMMTKMMVWAIEQEKKYVYLGSAQRPNDTYKFQFSGMEWFDGREWKNDIEEIKNILQNLPRE